MIVTAKTHRAADLHPPMSEAKTREEPVFTIEIKVNGELVGGATVKNVSQLSDLSDYDVLVAEKGSAETGLGDFRADTKIAGHRRRQTVWALVQKVAERAQELRLQESRG